MNNLEKEIVRLKDHIKKLNNDVILYQRCFELSVEEIIYLVNPCLSLDSYNKLFNSTYNDIKIEAMEDLK